MRASVVSSNLSPSVKMAPRKVWGGVAVRVSGPGPQRAPRPQTHSVKRKLLLRRDTECCQQDGPERPLLGENRKLGCIQHVPAFNIHVPERERDGQTHLPQHARGEAMAPDGHRRLSREESGRVSGSNAKNANHLRADMFPPSDATFRSSQIRTLRQALQTTGHLQ